MPEHPIVVWMSYCWVYRRASIRPNDAADLIAMHALRFGIENGKDLSDALRRLFDQVPELGGASEDTLAAQIIQLVIDETQHLETSNAESAAETKPDSL